VRPYTPHRNRLLVMVLVYIQWGHVVSYGACLHQIGTGC